MSLFQLGQGVSWGGHSMFLFYVWYFCFWPGVLPNQRQLSIVSDWEPYLGSLCSHYDLWVVVFCLVYVTLQYCFVSYISLCYFVLCVQSINYEEHLPRCILVWSFLLFFRRRRDSLQAQSAPVKTWRQAETCQSTGVFILHSGMSNNSAISLVNHFICDWMLCLSSSKWMFDPCDIL